MTYVTTINNNTNNPNKLGKGVTVTTTTTLESYHKICNYLSILQCILLISQSFISVVSLCINETFWWSQVMSALSFITVLYFIVLLTLLQFYETFNIKIQKFNQFYEKFNKDELRFIFYVILNQLTAVCISRVSKQLQLTSLSFYVINLSLNILILIDLLLQRKQSKVRHLRGVESSIESNAQQNIYQDVQQDGQQSISQNIQNFTAESV